MIPLLTWLWVSQPFVIALFLQNKLLSLFGKHTQAPWVTTLIQVAVLWWCIFKEPLQMISEVLQATAL